jgi:hypothetical protein
LKKNRDLGLNRIQVTSSEMDGLSAEMEKLKARLAELEQKKVELQARLRS